VEGHLAVGSVPELDAERSMPGRFASFPVFDRDPRSIKFCKVAWRRRNQ
jgi:hypothetical protein